MKNIFMTIITFILLAIMTVAAPADAANKKYSRTIQKYTLPNVTLINQDGKKVQLQSLIKGNKPVVVAFIYGTCTTICPVLSAGFVNLQKRLASSGQSARLVSITIDPENDTPKVMKDYLKRFHAKPGWDFLTGSRADIDATMKGFNAYIPDKMSHYPINLIRNPKDGTWVRLLGIMSSEEFLTEYQSVAGK